jgi:hypothetical protein
MACFQHAHDYTLVAETPEIHAKKSVCRFIEQEVNRPSKQWISNIIDGTQEKEDVVIRSEDFILLPDTERVNRYWPHGNARPTPRPLRQILNWLAIAQDKGIRTIRDLTGQHVPMLKQMMALSLEAIEKETGIRQDKVMAYVHYPPSVYQLHVHFSYPYGQFGHRDTYRIHNLATVINNLEIDPMYYRKATLHMAVLRQSLHFTALHNDSDEPADDPAPSLQHKSPAPPDPKTRNHAVGPCARSMCGIYQTNPWRSLQVQPPLRSAYRQVFPLVPASV